MKRRGELVKVSDLFSHYQSRLIAPQASVVAVLVEVVEDVCGIVVEPKKVTYHVASKTASFQVPSILKHEIIRHKGDILIHCRGRLGAKNCPKDIL